jgi:uncharacterized protein
VNPIIRFNLQVNSNSFQKNRSSKASNQAVLFASSAVRDTDMTPEHLGIGKSAFQFVASSLLHLVPRKFFDQLESQNFFPGASNPQMKFTLDQLKTLEPDSRTELASKIQEVTFQSSDQIEHYGWYVPAQQGKPTLLLSMANAWSIYALTKYTSLMKAGYGCLAYEYPGYGSTGGKPTETSIYASVEAASDFLEKEKSVPLHNQVSIGYSLGGAVAADIASKRQFKGVVLIAAWTSAPATAEVNLKKLFHVPSWLLPLHRLMKTQMDSLSKMDKITAPLLILHGDSDEFMPVKFAKQLFARAATPAHQKELCILAGETHAINQELENQKIKEFLDKL